MSENPYISLEEIIKISGVHPLKIRSVFLYGSRVYGYYTENSDFDIIVVAPNLIKHQEIKSEKYNIHIITPDWFKQELIGRYYITYLECIFAPEWARLQEKEKYNFIPNKDKVKKEMLAQSYSTWRNAKQKMIEGDTNRGVKSAFHSLKILKFGIQIIKNNKIIDFAECNDLYQEFEKQNFYEWYQIKDQYLNLKKELEETLKNL